MNRAVRVGDMVLCKENHLGSYIGIVLNVTVNSDGMINSDVIRIVWNDGLQEDWSCREFHDLHRIIG